MNNKLTYPEEGDSKIFWKVGNKLPRGNMSSNSRRLWTSSPATWKPQTKSTSIGNLMTLLTNTHLEANLLRTNTIYWMGRNVKTNLYTPAGRSNSSAIIVGCWTHRKMQRKSNKEYGTCFSFVYYTYFILRHVLAVQKGAIDQHFILLRSPQICWGAAGRLLRRQHLITYG